MQLPGCCIHTEAVDGEKHRVQPPTVLTFCGPGGGNDRAHIDKLWVILENYKVDKLVINAIRSSYIKTLIKIKITHQKHQNHLT